MADSPANEFHPLYLQGIEEFNRRRYFDSHEAWEGLWINATGSQRSFYKGLIQAAVALHHLERGNAHGAVKLLQGSRRYLEAFRPRHLGLDVDGFLNSLERFVDQRLAGRGAIAEGPPAIRVANPPHPHAI